jgi:hypothetical protein
LLLLLAGLLLAAVHSVESKSHSLQPQSQSHSKAAIFLPTINNPAMAAVVLVAAVVDPAAADNESSFEIFLCTASSSASLVVDDYSGQTNHHNIFSRHF